MIGAGTFISRLIKIVTTVAILAAVYFFILKPTLDTTNDAIDRSFDAFSPAIEEAQDLGPQIQKSIRQAQKLQQTQAQPSAQQVQDANKLLKCINAAPGDVDKIQTCNAKYTP